LGGLQEFRGDNAFVLMLVFCSKISRLSLLYLSKVSEI
jgi:hypothetical protein